MSTTPPTFPNKLPDDVLALPSGPLVEASLAAARAAVHPSVLNHSIRGFYWARLFAAHRGFSTTRTTTRNSSSPPT